MRELENEELAMVGGGLTRTGGDELRLPTVYAIGFTWLGGGGGGGGGARSSGGIRSVVGGRTLVPVQQSMGPPTNPADDPDPDGNGLDSEFEEFVEDAFDELFADVLDAKFVNGEFVLSAKVPVYVDNNGVEGFQTFNQGPSPDTVYVPGDNILVDPVFEGAEDVVDIAAIANAFFAEVPRVQRGGR